MFGVNLKFSKAQFPVCFNYSVAHLSLQPWPLPAQFRTGPKVPRTSHFPGFVKIMQFCSIFFEFFVLLVLVPNLILYIRSSSLSAVCEGVLGQNCFLLFVFLFTRLLNSNLILHLWPSSLSAACEGVLGWNCLYTFLFSLFYRFRCFSPYSSEPWWNPRPSVWIDCWNGTHR